MKRIMLIVGYDGTNYCGWQTQINGITVEEVLNKKLSQLLKEEIVVIGASRTDSGVHALGNVCVFDTDTQIPPEKLSYALNQRLPEDIKVQSSKEVDDDFHPRKVKAIKTYEYKVLNKKHEIPTLRLYTHFVYHKLDIKKMRKASKYLIGEHDFISFSSARGQAKTTIRNVTEIKISKKDDVISIKVSGYGFLYNMVRIIAGTLLKVGMGIYPPEHVKKIIESKDRKMSAPKAPAKGLTLLNISYFE